MKLNPEWENAHYELAYVKDGVVVPNGAEIRFNEEPPKKFIGFDHMLSFALKHSIPKYVNDEN